MSNITIHGGAVWYSVSLIHFVGQYACVQMMSLCSESTRHTGMYVCMHKHVPHAERLGSCHPGSWSGCELGYQCILSWIFKWKWRYLFGFIGCLPGLGQPEVQWDTSLIAVFCLLSTWQE